MPYYLHSMLKFVNSFARLMFLCRLLLSILHFVRACRHNSILDFSCSNLRRVISCGLNKCVVSFFFVVDGFFFKKKMMIFLLKLGQTCQWVLCVVCGRSFDVSSSYIKNLNFVIARWLSLSLSHYDIDCSEFLNIIIHDGSWLWARARRLSLRRCLRWCSHHPQHCLSG